MPARVTFSIGDGPLAGQEFIFEERSICVMGRAEGCKPRLLYKPEEPKAPENRKISRHHCLLDINPPDVRIRDLGSLNGTFVNGQKIGQRSKDEKPGDVQASLFSEYDLKDGDELWLGKLRLRVSVVVPIVCAECGTEMAEAEPNHAVGEAAPCMCAECRKRLEQANLSTQTRPTIPEPVRRCARCGSDVTGQTGTNRPGEFVCSECREDPARLLRNLVRAAARGDRALTPVTGYEMIRELGRGGMGMVYLARHQQTGRQVALKVMLPKVAASERATQSFLREARNTQALQHPNVVRLWDSGCSEGTFFFTLEYCDGGSVEKLMAQRGGRLSIDTALAIILQALDGLHYAHHAEIPEVVLQDGRIGRGRGLVHRDIKPQNIFLSTQEGSQAAKIGDYGLAKAFDMAGLSGHTYMGEVAGTPKFMPRQQVQRFKDVQPEADVWAMAASLYFMLTTCHPRDFPKGSDPWQAILQTNAVPIRQRDPGIPPRLAEVIDHALVDEPQIGFRSAAELKQALVQVAG
ncbi:MAG: protein kinase [Thermoguttaceae bacterium]|jgi:serine/threonine-protein kinase|nr:protein kinase [Thermoguttaceae bacterium]